MPAAGEMVPTTPAVTEDASDGRPTWPRRRDPPYGRPGLGQFGRSIVSTATSFWV